MGRRFTISTLLVVGFTFLIVFSTTLPVGISYAASDSMEPTIGVNDGFIQVPAGNVEPGDIIVFESPNRDHQYTVHRVVKETPRGFVTKGDNNEVTDQAAGYRYVQRTDIHGQALAIGGTLLIIPNLGILIQFIQTYQTVLLALLAGLLVLDAVTDDNDTGRPMRAGAALNTLTIMAVIGLVCLILLGGATTSLSMVAVSGDASAPQTIPVDEPANKTIRVTQLSQTPLTHYAVDAAGLTLVDQRWNNSTFMLATTIPPQQTTGVHETTITVNAYPLSLPASLIDRLHAIHPALAAVLTSLAAIGPWYLLGWIFIDANARLRGGKPLDRFRRRIQR